MTEYIECGHLSVYRVDIKVLNSKETEPKENFGSIKVLVDSTDCDVKELLPAFVKSGIRRYISKYKGEDRLEDYLVSMDYQKLGYDELVDALNLFAKYGMDSPVMILETYDGSQITTLTTEGKVTREVSKE